MCVPPGCLATEVSVDEETWLLLIKSSWIIYQQNIFIFLFHHCSISVCLCLSEYKHPFINVLTHIQHIHQSRFTNDATNTDNHPSFSWDTENREEFSNRSIFSDMFTEHTAEACSKDLLVGVDRPFRHLTFVGCNQIWFGSVPAGLWIIIPLLIFNSFVKNSKWTKKHIFGESVPITNTNILIQSLSDEVNFYLLDCFMLPWLTRRSFLWRSPERTESFLLKLIIRITTTVSSTCFCFSSVVLIVGFSPLAFLF